MQSEKKRTKEDTWKSDDLKRHIKGVLNDNDNDRRKEKSRRDEEQMKSSSGESQERRHRDRESRGHREEERHRDRTRERPKERDQERRKESERNRTSERRERDQGRRKERERGGDAERSRNKDGESEIKDRSHSDRDRGTLRESRDKERDRERRKAERDRERGKERPGERQEWEAEREGRHQDQIKEREREKHRSKEKERDREHGRHLSREKEHDPERRKEKDRQQKKERDLEEDTKRDDGRKEQHKDQDPSRQRENKESAEQQRNENEERERRHRDRGEHSKKSALEGPGESRRHRRDSRAGEGEHRRRERKEEDRQLPDDRERRRGKKEKRDNHGERSHREGKNGGLESHKARISADELHQDKTLPRKEKSLLGGVENIKPQRERKETKVGEDDKEQFVLDKSSAEDVINEETAEDYEEDFEDYDDDFEDVDENDEGNKSDTNEDVHEKEEFTPHNRAEIEAIQKAISAENERIGTIHPSTVENNKSNWGSESSPSKGTHQGRFIDFVAAKQREVSKNVACKQKKRSTELLRLIDLDFSVSFSLLDLPPLNEYDMYIKNFGTTNTKQAYIQCNEDNIDRDIQTEETETVEKWTQHPGDGSVVCGGSKSNNESSNGSMTKLSIDSKRLSSFLRAATQVIAVLLEEDRAEQHSLKKLKSQEDCLSFSDGSLQLNTKLPFLHGREVCLIRFSQIQRQVMLSVHRPLKSSGAVRLDSKSIVCIWNIWEPSRPQKVLICESEIQCCCFSPGQATLVFAGTADGSVIVWDLREHSSLHHTMKIGEQDWTLRFPTFSTDSVLATSGHFSQVRAVEPVQVDVTEGQSPGFFLLSSEEESLGLSFQLASLDDSGVLNLWVVVELPKASLAGSQTDLGLKPGGKVKLLHSSSIITNDRSSLGDVLQVGPLQALTLKFLPSDSNHFFIGTDMGLVNHGTRHGVRIPPKFYKPQASGYNPVSVTSVDFSPCGEPAFLVGCADGTIRMHSVRTEYPVMEWNCSTNGEPVISVQWAVTRPTVFFVLDATSNIYAWDLMKNSSQPLLKEKNQSDRITAFAVFGDPGKPNTFSGISLAKQSGKIEIQYFNKQWAIPNSDESKKLNDILCWAC
uniref:Dynein 2 intermediate chain 1 n=1 Tax=Lepisosteus oculatus TaxID=7918 RepID=W5N3L5_LEPOC|nr:PREDICTED: WD repeat-containing protein 60 [Lepisosteus oculatus]